MIPQAAKPNPEKAPAAGTPGAAPAPAQGPASPAAAAPGAALTAPQVPTQGYIIMGKSDPFRPFMETDLATKLKKEEEFKKRELRKVNRPISPLQQADIAQFRLVGIAGDGDKRTAVVEDATGKRYYPLLVGTYIGQNGGRVSAILDDRVIVEERITDQDQDGKPAKKAKIRRVTVMLHKEKEEGKQ
jgi:type IV pilus assembly protein PilP